MRKYIRPDAPPRATLARGSNMTNAPQGAVTLPSRRKLVVLVKRQRPTRLVIETVTLRDGRTRHLVTRRGDLAVLYDAPNLEAARAYILAH